MAELFRKKTLERVSAPDQLNDYIRVSNPALWSVLAGILLLLIGLLIWGITGRLNTVMTAAAIAEDGTLTMLIPEAEGENIRSGMEVHVEGQTLTIAEVSARPVQLTSKTDAYAMHIGGLNEGDWVYMVSMPAELADGIYQTSVTIESVSPISFIFN